MRGECGHRGIGTIRQAQSDGDRGEAFLRKHGMPDEGFGQQPHLRKIHQDRLPVLVDAEVAGVHVGLCEHEAITAYLDGRQLLLGLGREQRVRLVQIAC
jgi:hypothetical protein